MESGLKSAEPTEPRSGPELMKAAAEGRKLTPAEQDDATAWLLSDSPEVAPIARRMLEVNVGTDEMPQKIEWHIQALDGDDLRRIQARMERETRSRRNQETDELAYHARVLVAGTTEPDIKAIAKQKGAGDPAEFVRQRFAHKPGLIPQITAEIMQLSGFDDTHVTEVDSAGN